MLALLLETATIGKTHGTDGYLRVYSLSGEYSHLRKLKRCVVRLSSGEELTLDIDSVQSKGELFLMRFSGYETPEKARVLSKAAMLIERDKAPKLKKGEYYTADLYNMDVLVDSKKVGVVECTLDGGQAVLLCVRRIDNDKTYLVPNLPVYVNSVDIEKNTLDLIYPGLLEL